MTRTVLPWSTSRRSGTLVRVLPVASELYIFSALLYSSFIVARLFSYCGACNVAAELGAYTLNFHGRVTKASVKNLQLVHPDDRELYIDFEDNR